MTNKKMYTRLELEKLCHGPAEKTAANQLIRQDTLKVLDKVTIITTPHDIHRYPCLLRFLKYYEGYNFPVKILILNSCSHDVMLDELRIMIQNPMIKHMKFNHETGFVEKLLMGLDQVETPYTVISGEDDFVIPSGLKKAVTFLENNPDYSIADGRYLSFDRYRENKNDGVQIKFKPIYNSESIAYQGSKERLSYYLETYMAPSFGSVHRTELQKVLWGKTFRYTDDYVFLELLPAMLAIINGKFKSLDTLYCVREYDPASLGQTIGGLGALIKDDSYKIKYLRFKKCLAGTLCDQAGLSYGESEKLIDRAMNGYLKKRFGLSMNALRFKLMVKKSVIGEILDNIGLLTVYRKVKSNLKQFSNKSVVSSGIPYDDPAHPCYSELSRIREAINSGA